ncbi:MAG: sugar O-acetyltransferase [Rudaea sp.]
MAAEKSRMLVGELYDPRDVELASDRQRAHSLCLELTAGSPADRPRILRALFARDTVPTVTPPFFCDYGYNIEAGDSVYFNCNCVLLDACHIAIGDHTLIGPGVHIYTATHPMTAAERRRGLEFGRPVSIGQDVWIGGGSILCPGTDIGPGTVVGAGSVVTRSLPAGVLAAGNPCRVIGPLERPR